MIASEATVHRGRELLLLDDMEPLTMQGSGMP